MKLTFLGAAREVTGSCYLGLYAQTLEISRWVIFWLTGNKCFPFTGFARHFCGGLWLKNCAKNTVGLFEHTETALNRFSDTSKIQGGKFRGFGRTTPVR